MQFSGFIIFDFHGCSIIAQERLERITQFVNEMAIQDSVLPVVTTQDQTDESFDSTNGEGSTDLIPSPIPIDNILGFMPATIEVVPNNEVQACSLSQLEPQSPESGSVDEASDNSHARELGNDTRENLQRSGDFASKVSRSHSDCFERVHEIFENGQNLSEGGTNHSSVSRTLTRVSSSDSFFMWYIFLILSLFHLHVLPLISDLSLYVPLNCINCKGWIQCGSSIEKNFAGTCPL